MVEEWEELSRQQVAHYHVFAVEQTRTRSPRTGNVHDFTLLAMNTWVNIIALTPEQRVVLIHQYRHGTREVGLEIPGGVAETVDGSPAESARRELLEETGYAGAELVELGKVAPNPAIQDNWCYTFLALDARRQGPQRLDAGEDITVEEVPVERIPALIAAGRISHGLVVVAFYLFDQYRAAHPERLST